MRINRSIIIYSFLIVDVELFIAIFIHGGGYNDYINAIVMVATAIFSILIAFLISMAHGRLTKINETLKQHEGNLLFIYQLTDLFGEQSKKEVQELIDLYLIDQLDYYLYDFKYSNKSFFKLFTYLIKLEAKNPTQEISYASIQSAIADCSKDRKIVESLVNERLSILEWFSIVSLLSLIIFIVFYMNTGGLVEIVITVVLSSSVIALTFVLKQLNNLSWKEDSWIWEPMQILFKELDLIPYLPDGVVKKHRARIAVGEKIRIAHYKNTYPDMTEKTIEIIEI